MSNALGTPDRSLRSRDVRAWARDRAAKLRVRAPFDDGGDIDRGNAAEEILAPEFPARKRMIGRAALGALVAVASTEQVLATSLDLPGDAERMIVAYSCSDDAERSVEYVNAGENRLALVPIGGATRLFVNVISGSGARYVSGSLEWWSKGRAATLSDAMAGPEAQPVTCRE